MLKREKKNRKRRYKKELHSGYNFATHEKLTSGQKAYRFCFLDDNQFIDPKKYKKEKSFKSRTGVDPLDRVTVKEGNKTVSKERKESMRPFITNWIESSDKADEDMRKNQEFYSEKCVGDSCYENNRYHDKLNKHKDVYTLYQMKEKFDNLSTDVPSIIDVTDSKGNYKGYYTYVGDNKYQFVEKDVSHRRQDNDFGDGEINYV